MKDRYTKSMLTVIALCLCLLVAGNTKQFFIEDAQASDCGDALEEIQRLRRERVPTWRLVDDIEKIVKEQASDTVYRILHCLDGSIVESDGWFDTKMNWKDGMCSREKDRNTL